MKDEKLSLTSRLVIGGIAGFAGTMAMTVAMRRLHQRLPAKERYPLTPREIIDSGSKQIGLPLKNEAAKDLTAAAHFAYGAACGALLAAADPDARKRTGAAAGVAICWRATWAGYRRWETSSPRPSTRRAATS